MGLTLLYAKASVLYLAAGVTVNLLDLARILQVSIMAFFFMQLYGFVAMMIYGVSYLFIPAFSHSTLHSLQLARVQFWLFNLGTISITVAFSGYVGGELILPLQFSAMLLLLVAVYLHVYNIWRTASGWRGSRRVSSALSCLPVCEEWARSL